MSWMAKLARVVTLISTLMICSTAFAADVITMAVREDAKPFVWKDKNTGQYVGFFWDICTEAVSRSGFHFEARAIDLPGRQKFLELGDGNYDLLCDPTTMTLDRMRNFSDEQNHGKASYLSFSPIVFVANSTFVEHARNIKPAGPTGTVIAPSGSTCQYVSDKIEPDATSSQGTGGPPPSTDDGQHWYDFSFSLKAKAPPKTDVYEIWGYIKDTSIGEILEASSDSLQNKDKACLKHVTTYAEGAREFCQGKWGRLFGDVDLVRAALADYREETGEACPVDPTDNSKARYEPYAFVVSAKNKDVFPERFTLALYGMFEDGTIGRLFAGHFPEDQKKSQYLTTLFSLNSIPPGPGTKDGTEPSTDTPKETSRAPRDRGSTYTRQ